ncbi:MAG: FAD-binding protein [Nevskiales bacterium]
MNWTDSELTGWGRSRRAHSQACRPERISEVFAALKQTPDLLTYGGGRSYGDAALNSAGHSLLTTRLDRLLSFDETTGELECEPGVNFRTLWQIFLPRGWLAPVSPGTAYATIGGAIATDVHGKNHDRDGGFGQHLQWFDLALPNGEVKRVSQGEQPELFATTVGGMGLTGIVVRAVFRLLRIPSSAVSVNRRRMVDLESFLAALEESRKRDRFSVGWVDALAPGGQLGRGILETADFAPQAPPGEYREPLRRVPFNFPAGTLNPLSVRAFNALYYRRIPAGGRARTEWLPKFLYPLDALQDWNRIYGRRGFYQFQCVIPDAQANRGLRQLLETIRSAGRGSFLAVLKTLGAEGPGYLSFPLRGYTLALDFPRQTGVEVLLQRLEDIAIEHGGRVYLAKDATLTRERFRAMYPRWQQFATILAQIDPQGRMQSDMARRLDLRGAGA